MTRDEILEMENYILALAYAPGKSGQTSEPIGGKTVLQKLLFHTRKAIQDTKGPGEIPHFYGPFDEQAEVVAEQLEASGYLRILDPRIELTERGAKEAEKVWKSEFSQRERAIIESLKVFFADLSVDEILAITYAKYAETATDSIVRKELDLRGKEIAINLVKKGKISMDLGAKIAKMELGDFMKELSRRKIPVVEREIVT
jgi:predicted HTH domain antitoxin